MKRDNPEKGAMSPEKSKNFAGIATGIFAPIYPVIAGQILNRTGIWKGIALDIGSGPGDLAYEVARISTLRVYALDISPEMVSVASEKIRNFGMVDQVTTVLGDVHQTGFPDSSFDLIFSRGSWFFWEDLPGAFREISRILSPQGLAYIGSGFGSASLRDKIVREMNEQDPDWKKGDQQRGSQCDPVRLAEILTLAGFVRTEFIQDDSGFWMVIQK